MKTISLECQDDVGIVRLDRGVTNPINLELVKELSETLLNVRKDGDLRSLILTSSNDKFFSIGFDIPQLYELEREDFRHFYQSFNRLCMDLYTLPKPTIAALTGHATAGGCILALCCDYRYVAAGRKLMGLNEVKLGVPVPYLADRILRDVVGVQNAREMMELGGFYQSDELLRLGMADRVFPLQEVLPRAVEQAGSLGALSQEAFGMIKASRVEVVEEQVTKRLAEKEDLFVAQWYSHEAREGLKAAMKAF